MTTFRTPWRALARSGAALGAAAALTLLTAGVASAHVTAQPGTAAKGSYAKVAFRVPDESATAGTVKLRVTLPSDHPIASVRTSPMPGWTTEVTKVPLSPPMEVEGSKVTEAVRTITWTAQPGTRLGPTEFADFEVSMGRLPDDTDRLVMPAAQTYDDGTVVNWDQVQAPGAAEPEHPAPTLELVAAVTATSGSDDTARWLGGTGLVLGALGLGLGAGAVARTRRLGRGGS